MICIGLFGSPGDLDLLKMKACICIQKMQSDFLQYKTTTIYSKCMTTGGNESMEITDPWAKNSRTLIETLGKKKSVLLAGGCIDFLLASSSVDQPHLPCVLSSCWDVLVLRAVSWCAPSVKVYWSSWSLQEYKEIEYQSPPSCKIVWWCFQQVWLGDYKQAIISLEFANSVN